MRPATAAPTAKATTVAQAPIFSVEKHHSDNSDSIVGDRNSNGTDDRNGNSYDVIGASLLSFLPHDGSNSNHERKHDSSDATMRNDAFSETGEKDFHNNSTIRHKRRNNTAENEAIPLCGARDRYRDTNNDTRSKHQNDCASLLLDGGRTYTASSTTDNSQQKIGRIPLRRKRILLRGPPQSGKSSLGMNLAYAEAEAENDCCGGLPCGCVAAIVYRPKRRRHSDNHHRNNNNNSNSNYNDYDENDDKCSSNGERFPLFCRSLPAQTGEVPADTTSNGTKEGLQATTLRNAEAAATATKRDEDDTWDPNTLNRIRICRVSSVRDLWEDMLALAGKPLHERPTRAIVVEDLDQIIVGSGGDHNQNSGSSGNNKKHNNYLVSMMLKTGEYRQHCCIQEAVVVWCFKDLSNGRIRIYGS